MTLSEDEFITLAANVRRVRTPAGAKKYGQPIGTIITADMIAHAKLYEAKHGKVSDSPDGKDTSKGISSGSSTPKKSSPAENYGTGSSKQAKAQQKSAQAVSDGTVKFKEGSLQGSNSFKLGSTKHHAPAGSKLIRSKKQSNVAYVLAPNGEVHMFTEAGEVEIPEYLNDILKEKFSNLKKNDPDYSLEEFDESTATKLADSGAGAVLLSDGEPAFTKIDDSTWEHATLGIHLKDEDLQTQFDSGTFQLQSAPEAQGKLDFDGMDEDTLAQTLEGLPVGKRLRMVVPGASGSVTMKKLENGNWQNTSYPNSPGADSKSLAQINAGMGWLKDDLGDEESEGGLADTWGNHKISEWQGLTKESPVSGIPAQAWATQKMQGMDKSPDLLSDDEFDSYDGEEVFRGVSSSDQKNDFAYGEHWVGNGGNGSGLYFSKDKGHAQKYGNYEDERLISAKLRSDAVIVDGNELEAQRQKDYEEAVASGNNLVAQLSSGDLNLYASARGIDGYSVEIEGSPSVVLTNRRAVVLRESDFAQPHISDLGDENGEEEQSSKAGDSAEGDGGGQAGVSDLPGTGGGDSGGGSPDGSEDSDDEGDELLGETHEGFHVPQEALDEIVDFLDESRKIPAIKVIWPELQPSLPEAKAIIDSIESKHALHVDGKRVKTAAKFTENERSSSIQAAGGSTPPVYKLEKSKENAKLFRAQMLKSLEGNKYSASVYVYSEEEYAEMDMFLADDGLSGIAIHNGDEIVSVFSTPDSKNKKVARHLVSVAVQNGGTRLDAFDTVLPDIYAAEGFKVKARLKWNDEYSPDGWDKNTFSKYNGGEPDVVFMQYDESGLDGTYTPGEGDYVDEYDQGLAATGGVVETSDEQDDSYQSLVPEGLKNDGPVEAVGENSLETRKSLIEDLHPSLGNKAYFTDADENTATGSELAIARDADGKVVGYVEYDELRFDSPEDLEELEEGEEPFPPQITVHGLYGTPDEYSGVGRVLMEHVARVSRDRGAELHVQGAVSSAKSFYQSMGANTNQTSVAIWDNDSRDLLADQHSEIKLKGAASSSDAADDSPGGMPEGVVNVTSLEDHDFQTNDEVWVDLGQHGTEKLFLNDSGEWESSDGVTFTDEELQDDIDEGLAYTVPKAQTTPEASSEGLTDAEKQSAIDALESHSGFQVKYGLKSLPDTHPLKDDDILKAELDSAKAAHPDLPPKQALLAHLKGEETEGNDQGTGGGSNESDAPTVTIGSKEPKKGIQGQTGGDFTKQEIQEAIDILEAYDKKFFKSELIKKGSPIGQLSPADIIGVDKDKDKNKQKFIDLLKSKLDRFEDSDDSGSTDSDESAAPTTIDEVIASDDMGLLDPEITEKEYSHGDKIESFEDFQALSAGRQVSDGEGNIYTKVGPDQWDTENLEDFGYGGGTYLPDNAFQGAILSETLTFHGPEVDAPSADVDAPTVDVDVDAPAVDVDAPEQDVHSIAPGKYNTGKGAKAHLFVKPDGTGIYKGMKNNVKSLSADEVKKNYDAGMSNFVSEVSPNEYPDPSVNSLTSSPLPSIDDLPDGTYTHGKGAKKTTYTVSGDSATAAVDPATHGDSKLSQHLNQDFWETAPNGSQVTNNYGSVLTKDDSVWRDSSDEQVNIPYWAHSNWRITKIGGEPTTTSLKKSSLKSKFLKGQLLNEDGTSVLPKNYSGTMFYYGQETNVATLAAFRKSIDDPELTFGPGILKNAGLASIDQALIKKKILGAHGAQNPETTIQWFRDDLDELLKNLDTSVPDGNASDLFEYDSLGNAKMPSGLAEFDVPGYYGISTGEATKQVKAIAALFGDGTVIGQLPTSMNKSQKVSWLSAVKQGDFKKAYQLELDASAHTGKSMPKGYMHPGYPENTETHSISWGPAVEGELPAGTKPDGEWSQVYTNQWSVEEVNNYLIKAQMQNPTYLTAAERRHWVDSHRNGNKNVTDEYSLRALSRKNSGDSPLSEEPEWTDGITPAKTYSYLFDSNEFPTNWLVHEAKDWYQDNQDAEGMPDFLEARAQSLYSTNYDDLDSYYKDHVIRAAVESYFQKKKDEYEAELLKPVYTKEAGQTKGSHPGAFFTDQFGKKYYGKWWNHEDQLSRYRLEIEHAGNKIGRAFGFKTADSRLLTQDDRYMQMQDIVPGIGDLTGFDYSTITPQMIADIEGEHMLDWMLQNDDTKSDNAILTASGNIVGIDKARSFKDYGSVQWHHNAPDGNISIYTRLYDAVKAGQISKETMDEAYLKVRSTASRMQSKSDQQFFDLIDEGSKNRPSWNISYKIDGKTVSQDVEGLKAAFADQKSKLVEKLDSEWDALYKSAGLGSLPEPPKKILGEGQISGFDDPELYGNVEKTGANGTATVVSNSSVIGGTVLLWQDKTKGSEEKNLNGEFFLGPKAQKEILDLLTISAIDVSSNKTQHKMFSSQDDKWDKILSAAKTVNTHAVDGKYNESTMSNFKNLREDMEKERAEWTPGLSATTQTIGGIPAHQFSTGKVVPIEFIDQYKLMLDYYAPTVDNIWEAYQNKGKTDVFEKYTPLEFAEGTSSYSNADGEKLYKMNDNSWIYNDGNSVQVISDSKAKLALESEGGWIPMVDADDSEADTSGVVIKKLSHTHEKSATTLGNGLKEVDYSSHGGVSGSSGQEFEITLPTGEVVYFRNAGSTQTPLAQQGKISFVARGKGGEDQSAEAMQNITQYLGTLGVNLGEADEEEAERIYWTEMYGILANRNHSNFHNDPYSKAYEEMEAKRKELNLPEDTFIEGMSDLMTTAEINAFWRALWAKYFSQKKVDELIQNRAYLPKYDHQNYDHPEVGTGQPYWERFDVDIKDIIATNALLASTLGKEPSQLVKGGGSLGAEERLRQLEDFHAGGASWSAGSDQSYGSSHNVYTRIVTKPGSHNAFYSPWALLRTRTYSFEGDAYGNKSYRKNGGGGAPKGAPASPLDAINTFKTWTSNETSLPHMATMLDLIEIYVFEDAKAREEMIQYLKSKGLEMIRGLPIEDRLVMRKNLSEAIQKIRTNWASM